MSLVQIASLLDFLEGQPELALGRITRSKEGRSLSKRLWQECATILNNVSADCVQKTGDQWRMFYNEYKHKVIKKIRMAREDMAATGGGHSKQIVLTPLQERLHNILGHDVGEPLPGVRHNPFSQIQNEGMHSGMNDTPQTSSLENVVIENLEVHQCMPNAQAVESCGILHTAEQAEQPIPSGSEALREFPSNPHTEPSISQVPVESVIVETNNEGNQQPAQRRRHRRRFQQGAYSEHDTEMARATATLGALEQASAEATLAQARAIERLATAIESLSERLKEPLKIILERPEDTQPQRKRSRVVYSDCE